MQEFYNVVKRAVFFCQNSRMTLKDLALPTERPERMTLKEAKEQAERRIGKNVGRNPGRCQPGFRNSGCLPSYPLPAAAQTWDSPAPVKRCLMSLFRCYPAVRVSQFASAVLAVKRVRFVSGTGTVWALHQLAVCRHFPADFCSDDSCRYCQYGIT